MTIDPSGKLASAPSELVELVRRQDLVRSHGIATHALDRQIEAKQRTLAQLEAPASGSSRVAP